ncbi:cAMP-dependent protein kinase catalytic subunit 1-like [Maniola hyperantus]|uniref:cAMP-dependent protein kinase catalytic subunit 1-like n=1 Tax=Aphantopus hyperantus TaxID=2795564 RepID=UPI001568CB7E|nr:cAMP-dependent protein kinase catalytic subunit 1-like [Maniola hyperantus]
MVIFDKREEKAETYSYELQLTHNRYLDSLKYEFTNRYNKVASRKYDKPVDDFDLVRVLGVGAFGTVFLVRDKNTFEYFAMKALVKAEVVKHKNVKQLYTEKNILQSVTFPSLISLHVSCKDNLYIYLVLPFEAGGELFTLVRRMGQLSEPLAQFYMAQVVLALEYLHHCSIVHRDLKPENILLNESGYIKLGDFGFSKVIKNRTWTICGTPEYIAPEIILSKGYTCSVDWWSFGILIYEIIAGHPPFYHSETMKLYEKILVGKFKSPDYMTPDCKSLIKHLLDVDPTKRYGSLKAGVFDIKSHAWFSEINWQNILHQKVFPPFIPICKNPGDAENFPEMSEAKLKKASKCAFEKEFEHF